MARPDLAGAIRAVLLAAAAGELDAAPLALEVCINEATPCSQHILRRGPDGALFVDERVLGELRLKVPAEAGTAGGRRLFPLAALPGMSATLDEARQRLNLQLAPEAFIVHRVSFEERTELPVRATPGALVDYDLTVQRDGRTTGGGLADLTFHYGTATLRTSLAGVAGDGRADGTRLETRFVHDSPEEMRRVILGDAISNPGGWGGSLRFGGVQIARSFATRPWLVTTPLLAARGTAVVPSTVDVFVEGQRVASTQVPAGPFEIDRLPAVTGAGELTVVVRDILGREQRLTQPFYVGAQFLRPGLTDYSFSFGAVRRHFGLESAAYGGAIGEATWRRGLDERTTIELHGELADGFTRAAGVETAMRLGDWGAFTVAAAASRAFERSGSLVALGLERLGDEITIAVRAIERSSGFRSVGDLDAADVLRRRLVGNLGWQLTRRTTLSLATAYDRFEERGSTQTTSLGLAWSTPFGHLSALGVYVRGQDRPGSAYLTWTRSLGARSTASASVFGDRSGSRGTRALASLQRSAPRGTGAGYDLRFASDGDFDAAADLRGERGALHLQAMRIESATVARATATGSLVAAGSTVLAARRIEQSYAIVDAGGIGGVSVFLDNQRIGRTGPDGRMLVEGLRSYDVNRPSIDATELPLDVRVAAAETYVRPPDRAGVLVRLPLARTRSAVLRLRLPDGAWVPAGARVALGETLTTVGFEGLVYLESVGERSRGEAEWTGGRCRFELPAPGVPSGREDHGEVRCER